MIYGDLTAFQRHNMFFPKHIKIDFFFLLPFLWSCIRTTCTQTPFLYLYSGERGQQKNHTTNNVNAQSVCETKPTTRKKKYYKFLETVSRLKIIEKRWINSFFGVYASVFPHISLYFHISHIFTVIGNCHTCNVLFDKNFPYLPFSTATI